MSSVISSNFAMLTLTSVLAYKLVLDLRSFNKNIPNYKICPLSWNNINFWLLFSKWTQKLKLFAIILIPRRGKIIQQEIGIVLKQREIIIQKLDPPLTKLKVPSIGSHVQIISCFFTNSKTLS